MSMTPDKATALRRPFPPESVGKLPKQMKRDDPDKGKCEQGSRYCADGHPCGGYHARSLHLDFVGHAAVTDRLLTVDPEWSWEPFALGPDGLPAVQGGNLWIRLTVCGVTRIGVGDGKNAKECIGDAIRNAAMRFGVALDLWAKENLVEFAQSAREESQTPAPAHPAEPSSVSTAQQISADQLKKMAAQMRDRGITERDKALLYVSDVVGREISSRNDLTRAEASKVIESLAKDNA